MEVKQLLLAVGNQLEQAGIADAGFDALQLVEHITGYTTAKILANPTGKIPQPQEEQVWQLAHRRMAGEPLQYILGRWEFYSLPFFVGPGVLIPRADTEILVDEALRLLEGVVSPRVVDLCTGSGCVAVALGINRPDATVEAVELSPKAAAYAQKNIQTNKADNVTLRLQDVLLGPGDVTHVDCITANPPYIPTGDLPQLQKEVGQEPALALDGGADGLTFYRAIIGQWVKALQPEGCMVLEVGIDQWEPVEALLQEKFQQVYVVPDLNDIPRVLMGVQKKEGV